MITKQLYLFILAAIGMIGCIILLAMGHNSSITTTFITLNSIGLGVGGYTAIKKGR